MSRHRFQRNEKLYQYALRSDWAYSAKLALAGLVIGVLLVPFLLSGSPDMQPLASTIEFLGWVFTAGFAGIAIFRFNQQRQASETIEGADDEVDTDEQAEEDRATADNDTERDR